MDEHFERFDLEKNEEVEKQDLKGQRNKEIRYFVPTCS